MGESARGRQHRFLGYAPDVDITNRVPIAAGRRQRTGRGHRWRPYLSSFLLVVLATLLGEVVRPFLAPTNLVMLYLLVVVIAAVRLGRGPASAAACLSVVLFDVIFVPPRFTPLVDDVEYLLTFAGLLGVGLVISNLAAEAREQAEAARRREAQTAASYELSRDLAVAVELEAIIAAIVTHVSRTFECEVVLLLPQGSELAVQQRSPGFLFDETEQNTASWAYQHVVPVGWGTDLSYANRGSYWPLQTASTVIGVLGIQCPPNAQPFAPDQQRLLATFAGHGALAIERAQLAEEAAQAQLLRAKEQLQTALLNSISHDLRTPLASITGALSSLQDDEDFLDAAARRELIETASGESERLNRLVGNLLDMTRLEAGALRVTPVLCDLQDAIGVALSQLQARVGVRPIEIELAAGLPLVALDFVLIVQVLNNLLDNALKYSPPATPLTIRASYDQDWVMVEVADRGSGIPPEALALVFEKFYRVPRADGVGGTGLGLSISRGIIEAHGGQIWAAPRPGGGSQVCFRLPTTQPGDSQGGTQHE
jgi:two-component system sensor histidine kinase KdpD